MIERLPYLFPLWALLITTAAYFYPTPFVALKADIVPLLSWVMFGMGLTLTWQDFKAVLIQPQVIAIAVMIQFVLMPLFAYGLSRSLHFNVDLMAGMLLVGTSAGGTASNVICYLARGNVALSVLMTLVSTLAAVFMMPLLMSVYLNQIMDVPVEKMLTQIVHIVLLPVLAGCLLNSRFHAVCQKIQLVLPVFSGAVIGLIIAIIMGLNHDRMTLLALPVFAAVVMHNGLGLLSGYGISKMLGYPEPICRTVSIEVAMQNSGLSVALAVQFFSVTAALPGAIFSFWHNLSGSLLAIYWRRQ